MKNFKTSFLSALVFFGTLLVLSVGYAAWTILDPADADGGKPLTSTLMKSIINSINDIGTRTDGIYSTGGNVGIGTASPGNKLQISAGNIGVDNGKGVISTAGSILKTGPGGGTWQITPAISANRFAVNDSSGTVDFIILSNGNVGIGTGSPQGKLEVYTSATNRTIVGSTLNSGGIWGTNTAGNLHLDSDGTMSDGRMYLNWYSGKGVAIGNGASSYGPISAASFNVASDRRLKENITTITDPLKKIKALRGVNFQWKSDHHKDIGFIAQEVEKILPDVVTTDAKGYKAVRYPNINAVLVEAIKEQQKQIEELKSENQKIREEVNILKKK